MKSSKLQNIIKIKKYTPTFFSISIDSFYETLKYNKITELNVRQRPEIILEINLPTGLVTKIENLLIQNNMSGKIWVVRSSSFQEDGLDMSYAGQFLSIIGIPDLNSLLVSIKLCWFQYYKSLLNNKYIGNVDKVGIDLIVQEMVRSKISGVSFIKERECLTEYIWGQGELLVNGDVTPEICYCENLDYPNLYSIKNTLHQELILIKIDNLCDKKIGEEIFWNGQHYRLLSKDLFNVNGYCHYCFVSNERIDTLITNLHKKLRIIANCFVNSIDVEWAIDENNQLFILQIRPQTVELGSFFNNNQILTQKDTEDCIVGTLVSEGEITAKLVYLDGQTKLEDVYGKIILCESFDPQYTNYLFNAKGLITLFGGYLSHGAIVARELGIPSVQQISIENFSSLKLLEGKKVTIEGNTVKVTELLDELTISNHSNNWFLESIDLKNSDYLEYFKLNYLGFFEKVTKKNNIDILKVIYDFNNYSNF
ncbi:PEP/pyruvate-binding domain-containing protein [Streptococcus suis]|uniref:Phosphoenolpyruvate synthase n=2 Tax=Streptococcus suis TaxID=1307 RepID=A0A1X9I267_STRSU|nr:PEP/pyruvate-binding domain-containing protein [Streptococcus suis]AER15038.1 phosphoenolpyruvate synthase [Streptococcus suis SS12]ANJ64224.1 phosphoenolpyruvate synthase [Streptococcus suis]MBL1181844.1 hypothetical protein [Streptococcus suis]MBL1188969.1 hypothetical protein [Streptococcus suis]MBL1190961.1 hypothetical protein [Streptococcus suis]